MQEFKGMVNGYLSDIFIRIEYGWSGTAVFDHEIQDLRNCYFSGKPVTIGDGAGNLVGHAFLKSCTLSWPMGASEPKMVMEFVGTGVPNLGARPPTPSTLVIDEPHKLLNCPFCGTEPKRYVSNNILHIECPECVSVGFHNHVRLGCLADSQWNRRIENQN